MDPRRQGPQSDALFSKEFAANLYSQDEGWQNGYGAMDPEQHGEQPSSKYSHLDPGQYGEQPSSKKFWNLRPGLCSFGQSTVANVLIFTLLPWAFFTLVMWPFALGYRRMPGLAWTVFVGFLIVSVGFVYASFTSWVRPKLYWRFLGCLCLLGALLGMLLGYYDFHKFGAGYYVYEKSHAYTNVLPSANPGAMQDAGIIQFSSAAAVDSSRTVGFKDGSMYCVAPIIDTSELEVPQEGDLLPKVNFWAAGIDCCEPRGAFLCGPLLNPKVRGGLVVKDATSLVFKVLPSFHTAIQEAASAYGLQTPEDSILVEWTADPDEAPIELWDKCVGFYARAVIRYLIVLLVLGLLGALFYDIHRMPRQHAVKK